MTNRLEPLEPPFEPEVAELLAQYPQANGYLLELFRLFANSPRFLRKAVPNLLDAGSPLPMRQREIVILRVTANLGCEYEWGVHVTAFSSRVGLDPDQVAATRNAPHDASCWDAPERLLLRVVDALCEQGTIPDPLYPAFQEAWTCEQQLEILALCGTYHTVSFVANSTRLPLETFGARFPQ